MTDKKSSVKTRVKKTAAALISAAPAEEIETEPVETVDGTKPVDGESNDVSADIAAKKPREEKPVRYYEAVGRRKRAVARVRLWTVRPSDSAAEGNFIINGKPYKIYFPAARAWQEAETAFKKLKAFNRFRVGVLVKGGGFQAQAEAVRHGVSRALIKFDPNFRKKLKKADYLRRDPREVERKKPGLKKARRAPQWTKR